jgi:hypothetical protein
MSILSLKLKIFKGNLIELVKSKSNLHSLFVITESKPIGGVNSKGRALMKFSKCTFTYPFCGGCYVYLRR